MAEDVLAMREFRFAPPERGECDVLVIAGEHSGDEQSARMLKNALEKLLFLQETLRSRSRLDLHLQAAGGLFRRLSGV